MTKRIEYRIALYDGLEEFRKGHLLTIEADGFPPTDLALYKVSGGWAVDHLRSGRSISQLGTEEMYGRGPTLEQSKIEVAEKFHLYGYAERIASTPKFDVLNEAYR